MANADTVSGEESSQDTIIERSADGTITSLVLYGTAWFVGQKVVSTGRFGAPRGTRGVIESIGEPYTEDRTSDVLIVRFPNDPVPVSLKPDDIRPYADA